MRISVHVKPNKKKMNMIQIGQTDYIIELTAPRQDNKANEQLMSIVAGHYHVAKSRVVIVRGKSYSKKILEII